MEGLWRGMPGLGEHGPVTQSFVTPWGRPHVPVYNTCGRYRVGTVGSRLAHWAQLSARTADPRDDQNCDGAYRRIQGYTNLVLATLKRTSQLPRQRIADLSEPAKTPHTSDGFSSWGVDCAKNSTVAVNEIIYPGNVPGLRPHSNLELVHAAP